MPDATILVTDDEEDIREIIADRLRYWGYQVAEASDGVECLEAVARQFPDLLVLDLRMPRLDGLEVLARLRADHPELAVLIVSASSERNVAEDSVARGATDYLLKPFEPEQLRAKVEAALENRGP